MGRIAKGEKCSFSECDEPAVRSLSTEEVSHAGLNLGDGKRVYLCKVHYKKFRRNPTVKRLKRIDKWRHRS